MKCEDKEIISSLLLAVTANFQHVRQSVENKEDVELVRAICLYGLGLVDAVCLINSDFKEYRTVAADKDDNDVQAFVAGAKALYDWAHKKGLIADKIPL